MVLKDKSIEVHTHTSHPLQPYELETEAEPVMVLDSEGRSLQQGDGKWIRKRVGNLALYSRALSGCHGVRGLLPEPLCEMRTLQKHSLERDRKSTGDCSDRTAVKVPLASSCKRQYLDLRQGKGKPPQENEEQKRMTHPKSSILEKTGRASNCYFNDTPCRQYHHLHSSP